MSDGPDVNPDFSLSARVLALQAGALGQLMSDTVAARLLDSESKVDAGRQALPAVRALRDAARGDLERAARPARTSR